MNLVKYAKIAELDKKKELEKVIYIAFFHQSLDKDFKFTIDDVLNWFDKLDFSLPNKSRLKASIAKSSRIIKKGKDDFRLHSKTVSMLEKDFPEIVIKSEEIITDDIILPDVLYANTRGFIESLSKQINSSYENNIFDGCAVLMRRLLEICLILSYEKLKIESEIQDASGNYKMLEGIVANAVNNTVLKLSRNSKSCIEDFRELGNFSAHKIYYNAKRKDIEKVMFNYRATLEELLYKSEIKK